MAPSYGDGFMGASENIDSALVFHPLVLGTVSNDVPVEGLGYRVTNTPLSTETSVKVIKDWQYPASQESLFEQYQVTMRLYANGVDTGRTETLSLKNDWTAIFRGLPYLDENNEPIVYTVVETWSNEDWIKIYGQVITVNTGKTPTYEVTVTNRYRWIDAFELPGTGGMGMPLYILCGLIIASAPLVYGFSLRRKYERRSRE
jgi:hypothetical protein